MKPRVSDVARRLVTGPRYISGEQLAKSNFKNPIDLQYLSPSIQVSASGGIGFNIRGVGANSFNAATEQTVGLQIDGVLYGFVDIGGDISDADRVEIDTNDSVRVNISVSDLCGSKWRRMAL